MRRFAAPDETFAGLGAEAVACLVSAGADLALVVDEQGVIRDLAYSGTSLRDERCDAWIGQALVQTVTKESRAKVEALLQDADNTSGQLRWRQVNHPSPQGADLPLSYCAVRVSDEGRAAPLRRSVVFGRDLRAMSVLQQSLVDAQQEALRDHWKLRDTLSRNRHLFQTASDGVLIVEAGSLKVLEANPSALALFGERAGKLVGSVFPTGLDESGIARVRGMLGTVQTTGKAEEVRAALGGVELNVAASMFRQEVGSLLVVRLVREQRAAPAAALPSAQAVLLKLVQSAPDCVVITDVEGQIVSANEAFLELVHLTAEPQVRGESLGRWLGRTGVELNVLITTLRQRGSIRLFPTSLRDDHGSTTDIEISATLAHEGDSTYLGFTIRDVSRRPSGAGRGDKELPRSASQLTELVGRVPMKDIVGETTDLIEQLCIEAALDLTRDNRAAAAEMLGLSRQSLYVKLRRYGLSEPLAEGDK
jgi:transcriptional regulator PpsR